MNAFKILCSNFLFLYLIATLHFLTSQALANDLSVLTYESLLGDNSLGPFLKKEFEKKCQCKINWLTAPDAAQMLTKIKRDNEFKKNSIDLVLGVDQNLAPSLESLSLPFEEKWRPNDWEKLHSVIQKSNLKSGFYPYNYGYFSFVADLHQLQKSKEEVPTRLSHLLELKWRKKIILQDPRTSTPGLAFLLWAEKINESDTTKFWKVFSKQWLILSPSWSGAYGMFLKEEAPLVWSYTTSQAFHEKQGQRGRYQSLIFQDGHPLQIEGAMILRKNNLSLAKDFLNFLLSVEVQKQIPERNWMYPAIRTISLPESFKNVQVPTKIYNEVIELNEIDLKLNRWKTAIRQ